MIIFCQILGVILIIAGTAIGGIATYMGHKKSQSTISSLQKADSPEEISRRSLEWQLETVLSEVKARKFSYTSFTSLQQMLDANNLNKKNFWILYEIYKLSTNEDSNNTVDVTIFFASYLGKLGLHTEYLTTFYEVYGRQPNEVELGIITQIENL